jgi:hypothetical protein
MIRNADEVREVFVGDTGPTINFLFMMPDRQALRDLTGHAAWVTVWYDGEAPHIEGRAAAVPVPQSDGIVRYVMRGDEYTKIGNVHLQATVEHPDYGTTVGGGHFRTSSQVVTNKVLARPA